MHARDGHGDAIAQDQRHHLHSPSDPDQLNILLVRSISMFQLVHV